MGQLRQLKQLRTQSGQLGLKVEARWQRWRQDLTFPAWYRWGPWSVLLAVGIGGFSWVLLLRQPTNPDDCDAVFWPFASASFRIYCAQEAAESQSLEGVIKAIHLIDALPQDHPLAPQISRLLQAWSRQALDLAEASFQAGDKARAIAFARQISPHAAVYEEVQARVTHWEQVWAEGEGIYDKAYSALQNLEWREAFQISIGLLEVDCRYWSDVKFADLSQQIILARQEDRKLGEARSLMARGGRENLVAAMEIIRQVKPESIIYPGAQKLLVTIAADLLELGETALRQGDYSEARANALAIPADVSGWQQAQDLILLANAADTAEIGMGQAIAQAIQQARRITPNRPLYGLAQEMTQRWQDDTQLLQVLAQAQQLAQTSRTGDLVKAIALLNTAPEGTPYRQKQRDVQIQQWQRVIQTREDQPLIQQAEALFALGTEPAQQEAIRVLQRIRPGRALYGQAQARISQWQTRESAETEPHGWATEPSQVSGNEQDQAWIQQAQAQAQLGNPAALALAIQTVNQIPQASPLRPEAEVLINTWGDTLLNFAQAQAPQDLDAAIATAQLIPPNHAAYGLAQELINNWQKAKASSVSAL